MFLGNIGIVDFVTKSNPKNSITGLFYHILITLWMCLFACSILKNEARVLYEV